MVLFFAVVSSVINGVVSPSLVKITFNRATEEVIVPVMVYCPLTAFPSAWVNVIDGTGLGVLLLQLKTDNPINAMIKILCFSIIFYFS